MSAEYILISQYVFFFLNGCRQQIVSPATTPHLMKMRASSEKRIAGAPPHITLHWLGSLPKTDALMKAYVPKCVSLTLTIV